jgi:hypothetical protein
MIHLTGFHRISTLRFHVAHSFLGIFFPVYPERKTVSISSEQLDRVIIGKSFPYDAIYHLFEKLPGGRQEVHVFWASDDGYGAYPAAQLIKEIVPPSKIEIQQGVGLSKCNKCGALVLDQSSNCSSC